MRLLQRVGRGWQEKNSGGTTYLWGGPPWCATGDVWNRRRNPGGSGRGVMRGGSSGGTASKVCRLARWELIVSRRGSLECRAGSRSVSRNVGGVIMVRKLYMCLSGCGWSSSLDRPGQGARAALRQSNKPQHADGPRWSFSPPCLSYSLIGGWWGTGAQSQHGVRGLSRLWLTQL